MPASDHKRGVCVSEVVGQNNGYVKHGIRES